VELANLSALALQIKKKMDCFATPGVETVTTVLAPFVGRTVHPTSEMMALSATSLPLMAEVLVTQPGPDVKRKSIRIVKRVASSSIPNAVKTSTHSDVVSVHPSAPQE
jgi:hypothetical protein